jgi:hypothetical protein
MAFADPVSIWGTDLFQRSYPHDVPSHSTFPGDLSFIYICQVCPPAVQVDRSTKTLLGGSVVAFLVTKWGLAMSKDEEISGPGARDFGLAPQVKGVSNQVSLSPARGSTGG